MSLISTRVPPDRPVRRVPASRSYTVLPASEPILPVVMLLPLMAVLPAVERSAKVTIPWKVISALDSVVLPALSVNVLLCSPASAVRVSPCRPCSMRVAASSPSSLPETSVRSPSTLSSRDAIPPESSDAVIFRPSTLAEISSMRPFRFFRVVLFTAAAESRRALPVLSMVHRWPDSLHSMT